MSTKARYLACVNLSKSKLQRILLETAVDRSTSIDAVNRSTAQHFIGLPKAHLRPTVRSTWFALLSSIILISLLYFTSHGEPVSDFPLPVNISPPDGVIHTDAFGYSFALDGDILVVGAPYTKVNALESQGKAYIYVRNGNSALNFTFLKSIIGSETDVNSYFGKSVDVYGDTIVVGAHNALETRGSVYIFQRNHGGTDNWGEAKRILRADNRKFTDFGRTVALHGDTLAVGAPLGYGEVLLFQRNQGGTDNWGNTQILSPTYTTLPLGKVASFGAALAFDGVTLVVGATRDSVLIDDLPVGSPTPPNNYPGAVHLYRQANGQWVREAKLFSSDVNPTANWFGQVYGSALAISGDLLFVGEQSGKVNDLYPGKVHVYQRGAGTLGTIGKPGVWGTLTTLTSNDGLTNDSFGQALYAIDDGVFVGSKKQGIGTVYFFRNPTATVTAGSVHPHLSLLWSQVYSFTTSKGEGNTFGFPLDGDDNTLLVGESSGNEENGLIRAYAKAALFAFDPNVTPTPTPSPTATPPVVEPASCLSTVTQEVYLPLVSRGTSTATAAEAQVEESLTQNQGPATINATSLITVLAPGCVIDGPVGTKLGAVEGAITKSLTISIAVTSAPTITLPASATVRGDYLHISAEKNQMAAIQSPFVVGVPVPTGADTAHLVLMHTVRPQEILGSEAQMAQWSYLPGVYDAASNLFFARLPYLLREGSTFVLVNHAGFTSPANPTVPPPLQAATVDQPTAQQFVAHCMLETFIDPIDCNTFQEALVSQMANEIYLRMTETFGYPKVLRLLDESGQFIVRQNALIVSSTANYAIYLISADDEQCAEIAGFYTPSSGLLGLCVTPGNPIDELEKNTLIHELFHAFQYTYPVVMRQWEAGRDQLWAIEGMANAAVKSHPDTSMKRYGKFGNTNLKDVDRPLPATGLRFEEYLAQDFWVYVGARHGRGLGYLHFVLAIGGANQDQYDFAFRTIFNQSFAENYWGWVKNQAIENIYDIGVGTGELCTLSDDALQTTRPEEFLASKTYWPYDVGSAFDRLPPLTGKLVELKFGPKTSALVSAGYSKCQGLTDPIAFAACRSAAQASLRVKFYVEGESLCWSETLPGVSEEGARTFTNITETKRYFAVVANVNPDEEQSYFLAIE